MKRKWSLRLCAAVLCAVLLGSCTAADSSQAESTAPADPLTGQELLYPDQRAVAVAIDNDTDSTTQWGIGSASVVMEALTENGCSTDLCLVYPSLRAMPVGRICTGGCSAGSRCCPSSAAATSTPGGIWNIIICARWMRWK